MNDIKDPASPYSFSYKLKNGVWKSARLMQIGLRLFQQTYGKSQPNRRKSTINLYYFFAANCVVGATYGDFLNNR